MAKSNEIEANQIKLKISSGGGFMTGWWAGI